GELLLTRLPVLPRSEVALLDRALLRVAAFALQEQLHAFPAAQAANRSDVSSHSISTVDSRCEAHSCPAANQCQSLLTNRHSPIPTTRPGYTRRRLVGRQPLCGIGVTSRIDFTSMPTVCSARIADSRPDPGPLTRTSTDRSP